MRKLAVPLILALLSSGAFAKDWKEIRFGVDPTYAPFESKMPDGKLVGFDIDLGNAMCAKLKARCVWVENAFDGIIPALQARKFDGIMSAMAVTEARAREIAFSDRLYDSPSRLVAKKSASILPTVPSLQGKRVGVAQGSTQESYARAYWEPKGIQIVSYQNQDLVYEDLLAGRVDATLTDAVQADLGFLKSLKGSSFAFAGNPVLDQKTLGAGIAIGMRKQDKDLRVALNKAFAELLKDGTYKKLEQKYFSFDIYH